MAQQAVNHSADSILLTLLSMVYHFDTALPIREVALTLSSLFIKLLITKLNMVNFFLFCIIF